MGHSYMHGGCHPTLMGYARGPGLGAELPHVTAGVREGRVEFGGPILPVATAIGGFWLGSKVSPFVGAVAGILAYYGTRLSVLAIRGDDLRTTA